MRLKKTPRESLPEKLSPTELGRLGDLLADAADEFSEHSCNDFDCPATAENTSIFTDIIRWQARQSGEEPDPELLANIPTADDTIFSSDHWAMGYFAQRCRALAEEGSGAPELSRAELEMVAALLELMVGYREIERDDHDITVDYTLPATAENRQFIAAVIQLEAPVRWQHRVEEVMSSEDEIAAPDFWVMRYFSERCKRLAAR